MSRTFLYSVIKQDSLSTAPGTLGTLGLQADNIYVAGMDTPKGDVFLTLRFGEMRRGFGASNRASAVVWAYDRDKDYLRIERMLFRVRELFEAVEAQKTAEGWITCIRWEGDSEDLADDVFRASARNSSFTVIDSGR